jgi:ATP-dependent protease Clp ATPase subunit
MPQCSFCQKPQSEVLRLVAGPQAFICDECAMLAVQMISVQHPEWRERLMRTLALLPKSPGNSSPGNSSPGSSPGEAS